MNCTECQRWCLESDGADLPAAVSAHLLDCADCRRAHQRAAALRQLMALKRCEQPDAGFEVRCLARVREGIAGLHPAPRGGWAKLVDMIFGQPGLVLRYAAAGVVLGLVGLNWLSVRNLPPLPTASIEAVRPAAPVTLLAGPPAVVLPPDDGPVAPAFFVASNQHPWLLQGSGRGQYGTGSRPVGFDY